MDNFFETQIKDDQWFKDLFDHAHDLIQIVHLDGTLMYVNKCWSGLLEYSKHEIQGSSIYDFIDEPDRSVYREYRSQVIDGVEPGRPIVFRLKSKSGRRISVEGFVTAKFEDGKAMYTRGIFRDITVKLQNESRLIQLNEEIKEREQNLHQLLMNAPDAVIVINKESRISFWNPKAEEIFGWSSTEVVDQRLQSVIIPLQYREAHEKGMKRYLTSGMAIVLNKTIEITALRKTGQEFYVSLSISPTFQDGQIAFIAFIRDITEQKNNQAELEKKTNELEHFARVSHHDLQEPLRKIIIFAEMVKSDSYDRLTEASKMHFQKISDAALRMNQALQDILEFASLDKEEPFTMVDLDEVLAAVQMDLELVISETHARITSDPLPTIKAVLHQMHQLFFNLVSNALKFSKPGEPPVLNITCATANRVEFTRLLDTDQNRKYYEIIFQDNGIGFNPEAAEKIFDMFQRLHNKNTYAGSGIGLALCKKVVANHGGNIWAESKPGEGATFKLLLPG